MAKVQGVLVRQPCGLVSRPRCSSQPTTSFSALGGKSVSGLRSYQLGNAQALVPRMASRKSSLTRLQVSAEGSKEATASVMAEIEAGPVTDATFDELVMKSPVPVLVDFWAPWCGPCRMIAPLVDEIAREYGSKIRAFKLNTDDSPGIATTYGIRSIPTCMIFVNGEKKDSIIGAVPKATLVQNLDKWIAEGLPKAS